MTINRVSYCLRKSDFIFIKEIFLNNMLNIVRIYVSHKENQQNVNHVGFFILRMNLDR
jgi:hypothetical protein